MREEPLSLQFFDVVTILLKYCVPKCHEKGETQAVIIDLIATLGFFCANNKENQVRSFHVKNKQETSGFKSILVSKLTLSRYYIIIKKTIASPNHCG